MQKVAQIWMILINFGFFLPGNKDSNPWLWDSNLLALPQNSQKDLNLRIPIRGFVSPLAGIGSKEGGRGGHKVVLGRARKNRVRTSASLLASESMTQARAQAEFPKK
jgi:hypothetical protein